MNTKALYSLLALVAVVGIFFISTHDSFGQSATSKMRGFGWSDTIGWISYSSVDCNPDNDGFYEAGEGLSGCPTSGPAGIYGVSVAGNGNLSGYGWSEHIGWIDFNQASGCPFGTCQPRLEGNNMKGWAKAIAADGKGWDGWISLGTQSGESITYGAVGTTNTTPQGTVTTFNGYPWGSDVVGWMTLNHDKGNSVVVVDDTDQCLNIAGIQATVPTGMIRDVSGNCAVPTDLCLNIADVQTTIPSTTTRDASGNCNCTNGSTNPPVCDNVDNDLCANISGIQTTVPAGMNRDAFGNCAVPPIVTACTPIINYDQPRTIVDTPSDACSATWSITYEEGAAACAGASTRCTFDTTTTGPATSFSKNDIQIGTHSLRCTTTGLAADGVTALQSKTTTRVPPPQCRLNPNYGEF